MSKEKASLFAKKGFLAEETYCADLSLHLFWLLNRCIRDLVLRVFARLFKSLVGKCLVLQLKKYEDKTILTNNKQCLKLLS